MDRSTTWTYRLRHDGVSWARILALPAAGACLHLRAAQLGGPALQGRMALCQLGLVLGQLALMLLGQTFLPPCKAIIRAQWRNRVLAHALGPGLFVGSVLWGIGDHLKLGAWTCPMLLVAPPAAVVASHAAEALAQAHAYGARSRAAWAPLAVVLLAATLARAPTAALLLPAAMALVPIVRGVWLYASCRRTSYVAQSTTPHPLSYALTTALEQASWWTPTLAVGLWFADEIAFCAPWSVALALAWSARQLGARLVYTRGRVGGAARHEAEAKTPRAVLGDALAGTVVVLVVMGAGVVLAPRWVLLLGRGYAQTQAFVLGLMPAACASVLSAPLRDDLLLRKLVTAELRASVLLWLTSSMTTLIFVALRGADGLVWALGTAQACALGARAMWWVSLRRVGSAGARPPGAARSRA